MLGLLKVLRILRLSSFIQKMNINANYKVLLKMVQLILYTLIVMHLLACFWY
jgi:hypothetical protein